MPEGAAGARMMKSVSCHMIAAVADRAIRDRQAEEEAVEEAAELSFVDGELPKSSRKNRGGEDREWLKLMTDNLEEVMRRANIMEGR